MRSMLKALIHHFRLAGQARAVRSSLYAVLDTAGSAVFFLLRLLRIVPPLPGPLVRDRVRKILLIRIDRLGDLVLSTPALRAMRESYPSAEIHVLVAGYARDIVAGNRHVDRVLVHGTAPLDGDYDIAVALHPGMTPNRLAFRSGAPYRAGYSGWGGSFFLTHAVRDDRAVRVRHETESALELVSLFGASTADHSTEVSVTETGENAAEEFLRSRGLAGSHPLIGLHPGSRQPYLRWRTEGFAAVADALIERHNASVIFFAGAAERPLADKVATHMRHTPVIADELGLATLISVIKRCDLFIANSTGPLHIAAGLGVPVVALFGPTHPLDSPHMWGPRSPRSIVLTAAPACGRRCQPTDCPSYSCIRDIPPEQVLAAARSLLEVKP
jgi:heptosyltransferase-2